jgi:hypothetical protein
VFTSSERAREAATIYNEQVDEKADLNVVKMMLNKNAWENIEDDKE